jgi:hypothetical protein
VQNLENQPTQGDVKQRHGCVTAWLIIMIVVYTATMFYSLISSNPEYNPYSLVIPQWVFFLLAFISLLNVIFAVFLLKWKKWGFWGFAITSVITMGVNIYAGQGVVQSIVGLVGVCVLFAILQIKENGKSAWENLA